MPPRPFEVYKFAYTFGGVEYRRPWIVIREPRTDAQGVLRVLLLGCSTKNYGRNDFKIDKSDPDLPATGIPAPNQPPADTFVYKLQPYDVPVAMIGPKKGELTGSLRARFEWWVGSA